MAFIPNYNKISHTITYCCNARASTSYDALKLPDILRLSGLEGKESLESLQSR